MLPPSGGRVKKLNYLILNPSHFHHLTKIHFMQHKKCITLIILFKFLNSHFDCNPEHNKQTLKIPLSLLHCRMNQNNEKFCGGFSHSECHFHLSFMHHMTHTRTQNDFMFVLSKNAQEVLWKCKILWCCLEIIVVVVVHVVDGCSFTRTCRRATTTMMIMMREKNDGLLLLRWWKGNFFLLFYSYCYLLGARWICEVFIKRRRRNLWK